MTINHNWIPYGTQPTTRLSEISAVRVCPKPGITWVGSSGRIFLNLLKMFSVPNEGSTWRIHRYYSSFYVFGVSKYKSFKDAHIFHSSHSFSEVEPMANLDRNGIIRKMPPDNHHPNCVLNCSSDTTFIPQKMVAKKGEMSHSRAEVRGLQGLENPPLVRWVSQRFKAHQWDLHGFPIDTFLSRRRVLHHGVMFILLNHGSSRWMFNCQVWLPESNSVRMVSW